ncbi:MAG: lysine 2,3-aminomutase [Bacteroidales bacterium]|nr:lysine 2,3-aminomutase [Bacteroidales bacterium]
MRLKNYNIYNFSSIPQLNNLDPKLLREMEVVSHILPFKSNNYIVEKLIDWNNIPEDPIFNINFYNKGMLKEEYYDMVSYYLNKENSKEQLANLIYKIRQELNPHPSGQIQYNLPELNGVKLKGMQHKYKETVLFFPIHGQTCHAYCTFCFRWPQFTSDMFLKIGMKNVELLIEYLKQHPEVTDILITGGDPMVMTARHLSQYINAIINARLQSIKTIRIGTKSLSYWPYRYISDPDSAKILSIFKKIVKKGYHLALMANFNHPRELQTEAVKKAIHNILKTGAVIRTQSPLLNHVNADPDVWIELWKQQIHLGMIPYYMFIPRDTGAQKYFAVPLVKAWDIFSEAYSHVSGICRTVRGPVMSANPGKIAIMGVSKIFDEKVITLNFIQGRNITWVNKPFFAKYDKNALWLSDLKPSFGEKEFFFERSFRNLLLDSKFKIADRADYSSLCS